MTKNKIALLSVFDKKGIVNFAKNLEKSGYKIIATENTGKELKKNNVFCVQAEKESKNPKGLDGCIKTISFQISAGILFDRLDSNHIEKTKKLKIKEISIVVCNFVNLKEAIKKPSDFNIKNIDVGGPLMVRAAAVNFKHVLVVVDPNDYKKVSDAILKNKVTDKLRKELAIKAFFYTYSYDYQIVNYLKNNES